MNITPETMDALFFSFNALMQKGLGTAWTGWNKFATTVNSSTGIEKYPSTVIGSGMREWVGERVVNAVKGKLLEVRNKDFEHTVGVSRNDIEDDMIGFYNALFTDLGIEAGSLWGKLATEALCKAGKWADGADFFSASRKIEKVPVNNVVAGALTMANYETARARMMAFSKADGSPLGLVPDTLMVGPALEGTAKRLLATDLIAEGNTTVSNIHKDECVVEVNPYMTGTHANKWFLLCTSRGFKPVAVQKRKEGALQRWDKDSDDCVKSKNQNEYGLHYRGAAVATSPYLVIGGNLG